MKPRNLLAPMSFVFLLCACTNPASPPEGKSAQQQMERSGDPVDGHRMAARIAAMRGAAILGDQATIQKQMELMNEDLRRSAKIPDSSRPIDREKARMVVRSIDGVRGVAWVDHDNLLVTVDHAYLRSQAMINEICLLLQPLGDTLAVVVNLQNTAARNHAELQSLSRNCQLQGDDRAFMQTRREMDVLPEKYRQQHATMRSLPSKKPDQAAINAALDDTPEM